MAEEGNAGTQTTEGQAESGPETTTAEAPAGDKGKPSGDKATGTTAKGTQEPSEDTFFDPASIKGKPELESAYKNMQRAFSKKMEAIKGDRKKIEAYDSFSKDPITNMQNMAKRYGYQLTRAEAAQAIQNNQNQVQQEPQTWEDVYKTAEQRAYNRVVEKLSPVIAEVQSLRKSNLEKMLDDSCPDWRQYEDEMASTLKQHPTLVSDPAKLYRMSVPPEVLESRAMQQALKKLESKAKGTVAGASTTKNKTLGDIPDKPLSFNEAVEFAKNKLREQGITAPR
jgi:hypothetical protein